MGLIFANLVKLLVYDYKALNPKKDNRPYPFLPGSPVFSPIQMPRKKLPLMIAVSVFGALIVLVYFFLVSGWMIVALIGATFLLGQLSSKIYFISTNLSFSVLPPMLSGIVYLAMSGELNLDAFLVGLPLVFIPGVIVITNLKMYQIFEMIENKSFNLRIWLYSISYGFIIYNVVIGIYHPIALISIIVFNITLLKTIKLIKSECKDPIPVATLGVLVHGGVLMVIAFSVLIA